MSEQAQVGDTVRLTIVIEGEVTESFCRLMVSGFILYLPNHTVEILSRATPPLPNEPGTWWLDGYGDMWRVTDGGELVYPPDSSTKPERYAPFRQLVLK